MMPNKALQRTRLNPGVKPLSSSPTVTRMLDFLLLIVIAAAMILVFRVLTAMQPGNSADKFATGIALAAAFLLFWVNDAVGIIGGSNNDANMMYAGVIAIGIGGSIIAQAQDQVADPSAGASCNWLRKGSGGSRRRIQDAG